MCTAVVYLPVWSGGQLWDDQAHLTPPQLQSLHGLVRIWFDLGATQQYYPVVHSMFWLLNSGVGHAPLAYHLTNISLHAVSALMVVLIMRRLGVKGALLAAAVFALHPVQVESVAWMSELKNVLSGVCYLAAFLAYLTFDRVRAKGPYLLALGLFVLAVLSKSVTATLPFALLVVLWWQRGRIDLRRDVVPLVPMVAIGVASGLLTIWIERHVIGAQGSDYALTPIERILVAGRAVWFYAGTLVWPIGLSFNYPRWIVSQAEPLQYFYPLAALVAIGVCWSVRSRSRAPLASVLFFGITLSPALGFFDVYPFRYSFVADHFQYLATLGVIVPLCAWAAALTTRRLTAGQWQVAATALLVVLGALTWSYSRTFSGAETLYRATLARNPSSWLAEVNLGALLMEQSGAPSLAEAERHFMNATRLRPLGAEAHFDLGLARQKAGDIAGALPELREAVRLDPRHIKAKNSLAQVLAANQDAQNVSEAILLFEEVINVVPTDPVPHNNLGVVFAEHGQRDQAMAQFRAAIDARPDDPAGYSNLAVALATAGRVPAAMEILASGVAHVPSAAPLRASLGEALLAQDQPAAAIPHLERAISLQGDDAASLNNLGIALARLGRHAEAVAKYKSALAIQPAFANALVNEGLSLASLGNLNEAIACLGHALQLAPDDNETRVTMAQMMADSNHVDDAMSEVQRVLHAQPDNQAARHLLTRLRDAHRR